jgi:hypothetical protein
MKISMYAPYAKERFETARQHSILHPERIVGKHFPNRVPAQGFGSTNATILTING